MAEAGLVGQCWLCATMHGVNCRKHIQGAPGNYSNLKKDMSMFRPFSGCCRACMHFNKEHRTKGQDAPKVVEVFNLGFAIDCITSRYKVLIEETGKILISNQVRCDENLFPYRNEKVIDDLLTRPGYYDP